METNTSLAFDRTRLALERTMQAWVRTSASLITFGFSVYKFFELERGARPAAAIGSRQFGEMLVVLGLLALVLSTVEFRHNMKILNRQAHGTQSMSSVTIFVAGAVSLLGVVAFVMMIFRG